MNMKRAACAVIFIVALVASLFAADHLLRRDDSARKYGDFFTNKNDQYDVLFFGTSHVLGAVSPMEFWRDYGFTSYNMGNNSEPLEMTKWVMETAFKVHKPKVAVIDVFYTDKRIDEAWTFSFRHLFLDSQKLSPWKVNMVQNTLPKKSWGEFLVPFTLYHGRWEELLSGTSERLVDTEPFMMGVELRTKRAVPNPYERTEDMNDNVYPGYQPLRDMVALCRDNGVEPVFICIPSPATYDEQTAVNSVARIADELSVPYLNMHDIEGHVVDFETDCYDEYSHLNISGAMKVTKLLGEYLTENYDLPDHRGEAMAVKWNGNLEKYDAYVAEKWAEYSNQ